jgi:hypothetical protein
MCDSYFGKVQLMDSIHSISNTQISNRAKEKLNAERLALLLNKLDVMGGDSTITLEALEDAVIILTAEIGRLKGEC